MIDEIIEEFDLEVIEFIEYIIRLAGRAVRQYSSSQEDIGKATELKERKANNDHF